MSGPVRIAVLITCHDRRDRTVGCLERLDASLRSAGLRDTTEVFLVDDGSSDGTGAAALEAWPGLHLIAGTGDLFWARGMALAERAALEEAPDTTHLLWLNDDVELDADSVGRLFDVSRSSPEAIVVGALRSGDGGISYSGIRLTDGRHPLRFERIEPAAGPVAADTLNGNLVLVPTRVAVALGGIERAFRHAFADFDYGVRAREAGFPVLLAPTTFGSCDRDLPAPEPPSVAARWRRLMAPTGGALPDVVAYLRRHGPPWAVVYAAVPILRFAAGELSRVPLVGRLVPRRALPARRS